MLNCLVQLLIFAIVGLIFLYILEIVLAQFLPIPPPIKMLIRLLIGLLILIAALNCFGFLGTGPFFFRRC